MEGAGLVDQTEFHGDVGQLSRIAAAKLLSRILCPVAFDRSDANAEFGGDFLVGLAQRDAFENIDLAVCQVERIGGLAAGRLEGVDRNIL